MVSISSWLSRNINRSSNAHGHSEASFTRLYFGNQLCVAGVRPLFQGQIVSFLYYPWGSQCPSTMAQGLTSQYKYSMCDLTIIPLYLRTWTWTLRILCTKSTPSFSWLFKQQGLGVWLVHVVQDCWLHTVLWILEKRFSARLRGIARDPIVIRRPAYTGGCSKMLGLEGHFCWPAVTSGLILVPRNLFLIRISSAVRGRRQRQGSNPCYSSRTMWITYLSRGQVSNNDLCPNHAKHFLYRNPESSSCWYLES